MGQLMDELKGVVKSRYQGYKRKKGVERSATSGAMKIATDVYGGVSAVENDNSNKKIKRYVKSGDIPGAYKYARERRSYLRSL